MQRLRKLMQKKAADADDGIYLFYLRFVSMNVVIFHFISFFFFFSFKIEKEPATQKNNNAEQSTVPPPVSQQTNEVSTSEKN
jgi:hypothetical protein